MSGPAFPETEAHCLEMGEETCAEMVAHCLATYPEEGCGLLVGPPGEDRVTRCVPVANVASSGRVYRLDPREHLRADRRAEEEGLAVVGVFHSHTHTDPYPSPTDVDQAPDPGWHYVLVSLRDELASVRAYRIVAGVVSEEPVLFQGGGAAPSTGPHRAADRI